MAKRKRDLTMEQQLARGPMDLPFLMLVLLLTGIGVIMVFSASFATAYYEGRDPAYYFMRQALFAGAGLAIMYVISKINYQTFRWLSVFALGVAIRLSPRSNLSGIVGWLDKIGFLELIPYGLILLVIVFLMKLEPHMSGTILILAGAAAVLFAAGIKFYWFLLGGGAMGLLLALSMQGYQSTRILVWKDPWAYRQEGGYQIIQSLYAIGSGGLLGLGLGKSRQKFLYLPEPENDFIFAIVCEELGYIGAAVVILLFVLLIIRGYWLAVHARDRFGALLVVGITTLLAVQVFLNISVVTNLLPTTGISLPFFSYGGTALMIQLAEMGMVLSVSRQIPAPKQE